MAKEIEQALIGHGFKKQEDEGFDPIYAKQKPQSVVTLEKDGSFSHNYNKPGSSSKNRSEEGDAFAQGKFRSGADVHSYLKKETPWHYRSAADKGNDADSGKLPKYKKWD